MKSSMKNSIAKSQILGLILICPVLICALKLVLPELPASPFLRESFWAHKVDAKAEYDMVFVGDSRVYRGIDPEVFERGLYPVVKCFNFGFSSAGLDSFLLGHASRLLNPNGRKILVIGVSVNSFLPSSLENEHLRSVLKWNKKDIWIKKNLYPHLTYFDSYTPSDIYKIERGEKYFEQYHLNTGYAASQKVPMDSTSALSAYIAHFSRQNNEMRVGAEFLGYIKRLKEVGIKIIFVRIPTSHAMRVLEDRYGLVTIHQFQHEMNKLGLKWVEFAGRSYESYDGSHLDESSAWRFSIELAEMINICID